MSENYSYSKLDTFKQCHQKFKIKYVDGHYVSGGSVATEFGTLIHATEEAIANAIKENREIDYKTLKSNFITGAFEIQLKYPTDYNATDKSNRTYADKACFYLEHGIYRLENFMKSHPSYEIVGAEIPFEFNYSEKYTFKGFIDRMFKDNATGKYIVQDIKSWAVPKSEDELTTPLQFVVYSLAVKQMFNVDTNDIICQYDLPLCDLTQDAGTKGYIGRGVKKCDELFSKIELEDWTPSPSPLCAFCEYSKTNLNATEEAKYLCPYFCHWTRENRIFSKENIWMGQENHAAIMESYKKKYNL